MIILYCIIGIVYMSISLNDYIFVNGYIMLSVHVLSCCVFDFHQEWAVREISSLESKRLFFFNILGIMENVRNA